MHMNALVHTGSGTRYTQVPVPKPAEGHALIRVMVAGICRTDVQVSRGLLECAPDVTLGHEFSGVVVAGPQNLLGHTVSANPFSKRGQAGVHYNGAFAEYISLPADQVYVAPYYLNYHTAAYLEPVASALGASVHAKGRTLIIGQGRIATLLKRCVDPKVQVTVSMDPEDFDGSWDTVIEATPTKDMLYNVLKAVRVGGTVVLKSRADVTLDFPLKLAIEKQPVIRPCGHGSFSKAMEMLSERPEMVTDLVGLSYPLEGWSEAFKKEEERKVFLRCT